MKMVLILCLCLLAVINSYAQTVIELKSGKTVEGELVEKTDEYIKLNVYGVISTFWMDEIKHVSLPPESKTIIEEKTTSGDSQIQESPDTKDAQLIKDTITRFSAAFDNNDIDATLKEVSESFYAPDTETDYAKLKLSLEKLYELISSALASISRNNLEIKILEIKNDKAKTELFFDYKAFLLETATWIEIPNHHYANLQKENGEWKITQYSGFDLKPIIENLLPPNLRPEFSPDL